MSLPQAARCHVPFLEHGTRSQTTAVCALHRSPAKKMTACLLCDLAGERDGHLVHRLFRTLLIQVIELARTIQQHNATHLRKAVEPDT